MNVLLTPRLPFLQIILALTASLIPVANAFVILLIVIAICALLLLLLASPAKWVCQEYILWSDDDCSSARAHKSSNFNSARNCMRDLSYSRLVLNLDAVLGVNFFSIPAPGEFLKFDRAFACMFRIAAGETWIEDLPVRTPTNEA